MPDGPHHEIADVRTSEGELSFEARLIGAEPRRVFFRTDTPVTPNADAALAACLMPAMRTGGELRIEAPISERLLRDQAEFQAIQRAWSFEWPFGDPPLDEVEVSAPARSDARRQPVGRVAAFFSGGVDSFSTILGNPDITDLIFVHGLDILPWLPHQLQVREAIEARLRSAAGELGRPLHIVETDMRLVADPLLRWEYTSLCAPVAVALFLAPLFDRVLIAGDNDYEVQERRGANLLVDRLWSTENLEIAEDGGRVSRMEKVERIAGNPVVRKSLRTCWRNPEGAYNCGRCRKCLMTMAALKVAGDLEAVETFPSEIDFDRFGDEEINQLVSLSLFEDLRDAAHETGEAEIEAVAARMIAHGKVVLGLPPEYRSRRSTGGPVSARAELYATAKTARALAEAKAVAFLVGSYDGSGNFGDIAQLDATLSLLSPLRESLLSLPVVELAHFETDAELRGQMLNRFAALYFDPTGEGGRGLVPVGDAVRPRLALSYLYGGGYLNGLWGERKLAMLRACEALLGPDATSQRIASGLQVEAEWLAGLSPPDRRLLRSFRLFGTRDGASAEALLPFAEPGRVADFGDDATGLLGSLPGRDQASEGPTRVAAHFAEHDFATDQSGPILELIAATLAELQNLAGGALSVLPLIAYEDPRIDERPGLARLQEACAARGVAFEAPRPLRPGTLAEVAREIASTRLTLSCSYHVALTSLSLGVPAVLIEGNSYYRQKAAGLHERFRLPDGFRATPASDPAKLASTLAADAFAAERAEALRAGLREDAAKLRLRRSDGESRILAAVAAATVEAIGSSSDRNGHGDAGAERQLEVLLTSRSWRLTAPLRRLAQRQRERLSGRQ